MNISSATSGASAWSARTAGPPDSAQRAQAFFSKVDTEGSGGVDATELQSVLDKLSQKTGTDLGKAADRFASMDTNGDGSLSSSELSAGIKSLMPQPSSTMEFAQQRMGGGHGGGHGGHHGMPPQDSSSSSSSSSTGATGTSTSTDPLDTNGDGVVSAQERMAGELTQVLQQAIKAGDTNGDGSLSSSEVSSLSSKLSTTLDQMMGKTQAASSSSSSNTSSDSSKQGGAANDDAVKQLAQMLMRHYAPPAMSWQDSSSLSLAA